MGFDKFITEDFYEMVQYAFCLVTFCEIADAVY